jgi:heptosyltransferase II
MRSAANTATSRPRPSLTRLADYGLRVPAYVFGSKRLVHEAPVVKQSLRRLLIVKVHGMGDSVLIRALIELLQRMHPELEIGVLVGSATRELMTKGLTVWSHGYDQKKVMPRAIWSVWQEIRRTSYDAIANFEQGSLAGTAFLAFSGIQIHVGFVRTNQDPKCRLLSHPVKFRQSDSMWNSFLRLAQVLFPDLPAALPSIQLPRSSDSRYWAEEWWHQHIGADDRPAIAMHVGCGPGSDFRRWPLERFIALADRLKSRFSDGVIVLTGTALEQNLIHEFRKHFSGEVVDASDLGSIEKTALILKRCRLLISNDTGVMHLGAAMNTPTIGLFGPSSPALWAPLGKNATYVRETSLSCSPCMNNYLNLAPIKCMYHIEGQCMSDISVGSVESAVKRVIGGHRSAADT